MIDAIALFRTSPGAVLRGRLRGQRGFTLLEAAMSMAITALAIAPLGAILWQTTVVPAETSGAISVESQLRNTDVNLAEDFRTAQSFLPGADPVWGTAAWTDFTIATAEHRTATYFWVDSGDTMIRQEVIDGVLGPAFVIGRFMDDYSDVIMGFSDELPPFLLATSIFPEVDTPLGTQLKPESTEGGRRVSVLKRQEGAPVLLG